MLMKLIELGEAEKMTDKCFRKKATFDNGTTQYVYGTEKSIELYKVGNSYDSFNTKIHT